MEELGTCSATERAQGSNSQPKAEAEKWGLVGMEERKTAMPEAKGESDQPIVLGDGRAEHEGKGLTGVRSLKRKHEPYKGDGRRCKPHYRE